MSALWGDFMNRRIRCPKCNELVYKSHLGRHNGQFHPVRVKRRTLSDEVEKTSAEGCAPIVASVSALYINPRMMQVEDEQGAFHMVVVGDARRFWVGAPVLIRPSPDFGGEYYELTEAPPRFRGDHFYGVRMEAAMGLVTRQELAKESSLHGIHGTGSASGLGAAE